MGFLSNKIWVRIFLGHPVGMNSAAAAQLWDRPEMLTGSPNDVSKK